MKKYIRCVSLCLCSLFASLPLVAAGGIPPVRALRFRHTAHPASREIRVPRLANWRPNSFSLGPASGNILPTTVNRMPSVPIATPLPKRPENPFQDEEFIMADAVFERLASAERARRMEVLFPQEKASFPPSRAMQAWQERSAPEAQRSLFLEEARQLENLAATDPAHYNYLEGQLFDLLCQWKNTSYFSEDTFFQLQQALFPFSLAARLRWPQAWALSSQDSTRWPFVNPHETLAAGPLTFQPDLVVLIINDNEEVARAAANQLQNYAGHIFVAYNMQELNHFINRMKAQHLRPHYIISDGAIGHTVSDQDIKLTLKKSFPAIAQEMGFIILSDGLLDFYAEHNGYVSYLTRMEDHFENLDRLIGGLEEKYHIQEVIRQIP